MELSPRLDFPGLSGTLTSSAAPWWGGLLTGSRWDVDIRATDACVELSKGGSDVYDITSHDRKLLGNRLDFVPTRWPITAVDDTLSTALKKEIARFPTLDEYRFFSGGFFGNRIVCILAPGDWRYEMIEIWGRRTLWAWDTEVIVEVREARKTGIFPDFRCLLLGTACRVRYQGHPLLGTGDRAAPYLQWLLGAARDLGIREAARKAMESPPAFCESLDDAVAVASARIGFDYWQQHSTLIPEMRTQRTLFSF